jgi:hypothetical protein
MSETQKLWVRDKKVSLGDIGERGDQIQLGVRSVSLGRFLFHLVFPDFFNSSFQNG